MKFSSDRIESFCGDVLPLWLESDEDLSREDICWKADGDCVRITSLRDDGPLTVNHGVLLTLLREGECAVRASYKGNVYSCNVVSRRPKKFDTNGERRYFRGNFHDHTSMDHNVATFPYRTEWLPADYVEKVGEEGRLDCSAITDHAILMSNRDLFLSFTAAEEAKSHYGVVFFAGNESNVSIREYDRFGAPHNNAGEAVVINADSRAACDGWDSFLDAYKNSPYAIGFFCHPQEMGGGDTGLWDFDFEKKYTPALAKMMKGIAIGDGIPNSQSNDVNELAFSRALDAGFRVSTTSSGDRHGITKWGFSAVPGKTVLIANEKSKEAFLDALNSLRFYACESGNLKLDIRVNGVSAPCSLAKTDVYDFHVRVSYFENDESTFPALCEVISDKGRVVKKIENADFSDLEFTVRSDTARYFYLRFVDPSGRRTFSPPVFTGRKAEKYSDPGYKEIDKSAFTAVDLATGRDAGVLVNGDPNDIFVGKKTAEILIDMQKTRRVCAMGVYSPRCVAQELKEAGIKVHERIASFVCEYAVSTSTDGEIFTEAARGRLRVYGNEEIVPFPSRNARYVKFSALGTVGAYRGTGKLKDANVMIAELSLFTK